MPMRYGRVSPNGLWLAYQPRNRVEIRIVPLGAERVTAEDSRLLSPAGGNTGFGFTRDGSAVIYGDGSRAWSLPVSGDEPDEIPIRLAIERPVPPPVLLQRVRVLDYDMGGFGAETSMLIAGGRIQSVSAEASLPPGTVVLNAGGRFAIPGLFDMHTHACSWSVFIPYGITSVRHMGGTSGAALHGNLADRSTFTGAAVPRCFYAGPILQSPQSPRGGSRGNVA